MALTLSLGLNEGSLLSHIRLSLSLSLGAAELGQCQSLGRASLMRPNIININKNKTCHTRHTCMHQSLGRGSLIRTRMDESLFGHTHHSCMHVQSSTTLPTCLNKRSSLSCAMSHVSHHLGSQQDSTCIIKSSHVVGHLGHLSLFGCVYQDQPMCHSSQRYIPNIHPSEFLSRHELSHVYVMSFVDYV